MGHKEGRGGMEYPARRYYVPDSAPVRSFLFLAFLLRMWEAKLLATTNGFWYLSINQLKVE